MKKCKEYAIIFVAGGLFYSLLEILWRGWSHWTMTLTGGGCFLGIYLVNAGKRRGLFRRCLDGCLIITGAELLVGLLVNKALRWNVWDYSSMKCNLWGQICLLYSIIWFLLCIPCSPLCRVVRALFGRDEAEQKERGAYGEKTGRRA